MHALLCQSRASFTARCCDNSLCLAAAALGGECLQHHLARPVTTATQQPACSHTSGTQSIPLVQTQLSAHTVKMPRQQACHAVIRLLQIPHAALRPAHSGTPGSLVEGQAVCHQLWVAEYRLCCYDACLTLVPLSLCLSQTPLHMLDAWVVTRPAHRRSTAWCHQLSHGHRDRSSQGAETPKHHTGYAAV